MWPASARSASEPESTAPSTSTTSTVATMPSAIASRRRLLEPCAWSWPMTSRVRPRRWSSLSRPRLAQRRAHRGQDRAEGSRPVAQLVLLVGRQFGRTHERVVGFEHRVVPEPLLADGRLEHPTGPDAALCGLAAIPHERRRADELRDAVRLALEVLQQQGEVV